jgi:hypothetical protein
MNLLFAGLILRGSTNDPFIYLMIVALGIIIGSISFAYQRWGLFTQWLTGISGRDWPQVSAVVDVVTVVRQMEQTHDTERTIGYLATLTYFYHNPDLQIGEYSRMIDDEPEAQSWADSYKGNTVKVHVDPRDPSRSVLREEDL